MSQLPPGNAEPPREPLPPVEPPSARLILQLFLIPGILVILVVALVLWVLRSVGGGPQTSDEFVAALASGNEKRQWKAAQDLAQVLPRDAQLRANVPFALNMTDLLAKEARKPLPESPEPGGTPPSEMLEFLPAACGNFAAPVAWPLLEQLVRENHDKVDDKRACQRLHSALVAIGIVGARQREFRDLTPELQATVLDGLRTEAGPASGRQAWAQQALDHLQRETGKPSSLEAAVVPTLALAARAPDELARKYAILALANWDLPGVEPLLLSLCGDHSDIPDAGFARSEPRPGTEARPLTPTEKARDIEEIKLNAALALARKGSQRTPWDLVAKGLDEKGLQNGLYADKPGMAVNLVLKTLRDLQELQRTKPGMLDQHPTITETVASLAKDSPTVAIQVEATRVLKGDQITQAVGQRTSRELLMIAGIGVAVVLLLVLAVFARWRRVSSPPVQVSSGTSST